jgi:hypothetical protein
LRHSKLKPIQYHPASTSSVTVRFIVVIIPSIAIIADTPPAQNTHVCEEKFSMHLGLCTLDSPCLPGSHHFVIIIFITSSHFSTFIFSG